MVTSPGYEKNTCSGCGEINGITLTLSIGDNGPGGGKIFYRNTEGFIITYNNSTAYYLEAVPRINPRSPFVYLAWASTEKESTLISGTFGTEIGTGKKNTVLILAEDPLAPAAKACDEYINNGKEDWFLPSIDELNQLYKNLVEGKEENDFSTASMWTWSSSQYSGTGARGVSFYNGSLGDNIAKSNTVTADYANAIRAF